MINLVTLHFKIHILSCAITSILCTIDGVSYISASPGTPKGYITSVDGSQRRKDDPCNSLYWYPKHVPDYCYNRTEAPTTTTEPPPPPPPMPAPMPAYMPYPVPSVMVPAPPPLVLPMPAPPPQYMMAPPAPPPQYMMAPPAPPPQYMMAPSAPIGIPLPFNHFLPPPMFQRTAGLVPGIPGLVSNDGGINILPFSDIYSDMMERHKQKVISSKLKDLMDEYEDFGGSKYRSKLRHGTYLKG
ncbi:unnamed protein product [Plutella xylostella]|uniref:(diamondback moth) hypothetical protein n=1 Tax=Plutella xylostella TaxID=51655 RepID=A0A8S4GDL0_PLUXY|nr:unnamed protein product [Plutella xylostella]